MCQHHLDPRGRDEGRRSKGVDDLFAQARKDAGVAAFCILSLLHPDPEGEEVEETVRGLTGALLVVEAFQEIKTLRKALTKKGK